MELPRRSNDVDPAGHGPARDRHAEHPAPGSGPIVLGHIEGEGVGAVDGGYLVPGHAHSVGLEQLLVEGARNGVRRRAQVSPQGERRVWRPALPVRINGGTGAGDQMDGGRSGHRSARGSLGQARRRQCSNQQRQGKYGTSRKSSGHGVSSGVGVERWLRPPCDAP